MNFSLSKKKIFLVAGIILFSFLFIIFILNPAFFQILLSKLSKTPSPGSCLVLEEKYCKKVKLINDPSRENQILAAFKIPKETVLFAPVEGFYSNTPIFFFIKDHATQEIVKYPGARVSVGETNISKEIRASYSFIYFKEKEGVYSKIKKGEIIGWVSDKSIDYLGDYNLIVGLTKQDLIDGKTMFKNDINGLKAMLQIQ